MYNAVRQQLPGLADASVLFERAEYSRCLDLVKGIGGPEALSLRARCHLKMKEPLAALGVAGALPHGVERLSLLGTAASRLTRNEEAESYFREALGHAVAGTPASAELHYFYALHKWGIGDYAESESLLKEPLAAKGLSHVRALELHAWNLEGLLRYDEHVAGLKSALSALLSMPTVDLHILGALLHGLSAMARELYLPDLVPTIRKYSAMLPNNASMFVFRFYIERNIGWTCALNGDYAGAYRHLRNSREMAQDNVWKAWACVDRAFIAFAIGEHVAGQDTIEYAQSLLGSVDWSNTGEERMVLLILAATEASRNAALARHYLTTYHAIKSPISPLCAYKNSPRRKAIEDLAEALVLRAEGNRSEARTRLEAAWRFWTKVKFMPRVADAAIELAELRNDSKMIDCAEEILKRMPQSYIAARVSDRMRRWRITPYRELTDRQREVLHLALRGLTNQQIADELGVGMPAARNRLHDVFQKFGVTSRSQLLCECQRIGIT